MTLAHFLILALILFSIGAVGVILRRNILIILMNLEIMLNSLNLALVGISLHYKIAEPQSAVLIVLAVAAAEVAVGLVIAINMMRVKDSLNIDDFRIGRG